MKYVIDIPQGLKIDFENERWTALSCMEMKDALENGKLLDEVLGEIKIEIESHILDTNGLDFNSALYIAIEIINNYGKEQE